MNPTHIHLATIHATLRLGESDPACIAAETGIPLATTRRALLVLTSRRAARWDSDIGGYVPSGTAKSIRMRPVVSCVVRAP